MGFNPHMGNLIFRTDNRRNIKEVFTYDKMNRLAGYGENKVVYDIKGNIIKKTDAGRMLYTHSTKPYAVTEFIPQNGAIPVREQLISYTSLMRPATIRENGYVAAFTYDAAGRRVKTYVTKNGKPCSTSEVTIIPPPSLQSKRAEATGGYTPLSGIFREALCALPMKRGKLLQNTVTIHGEDLENPTIKNRSMRTNNPYSYSDEATQDTNTYPGSG